MIPQAAPGKRGCSGQLTLLLYNTLAPLRLLLRALQMESMMGDSRQSVMGLQTQLEEYRDRSRKELLEAQRSSKDRLAELQRSQTSLKAQQDEVRTEWGGRMQ